MWLKIVLINERSSDLLHVYKKRTLSILIQRMTIMSIIQAQKTMLP